MDGSEDVEYDDESFAKFLQILQCQFLSCFPVNKIKWKSIPMNLTWENQALILQATIGHRLNKDYPVKQDYQLSFLKHLIQVLERNCYGEVHDDIYNEFCKIQQQDSNAPSDISDNDLVFKHYVLPHYNVHLTMQETKSFVGKGTTGLCTWQASLALTDFLLHNEEYIKNKKILELGSGTGLCGMILMLCDCKPSVIILTDGSVECVDLMQENIKRNFPHSKLKDGIFELNNRSEYLGAFQLLWDQIEEFEFNEKLMPDLILAADVIYDEAMFNDLLDAINFLFDKMENNPRLIIAATVRNEETLEAFLLLANAKYEVRDCKVVPEEEAYVQWDRSTIVRILEITPK